MLLQLCLSLAACFSASNLSVRWHLISKELSLYALRFPTTSMFNDQFDKIHPYTNVSSASLLLVHERMALPYSPYLSLKEFHGVKLRYDFEIFASSIIVLLLVTHFWI